MHNHKSIVIPPPALRRLRECNEAEAWFPMTLLQFGPSDTKGYDWTFRDKRLRWNEVSTARLIEKYSKYKPGETVACKEPLIRCPGHAEYAYDRDGLSWVKESRELYEFLYTYPRANVPAKDMPLWAVRHHATVVSVEPRMLGSITANDVENAGFALANETGDKLPDGFNEWMPERRDEYLSSVASEIAGDVAGLMSAFIGQYNRDHPRHPFAPQDWAWRVRMESKL